MSGNRYGFKSRRPHAKALVNSGSQGFFIAFSIAFSIEKTAGGSGRSSRVVEMRGVEPLSENPSEGLSPSAFRDQISPVFLFTDGQAAE